MLFFSSPLHQEVSSLPSHKTIRIKNKSSMQATKESWAHIFPSIHIWPVKINMVNPTVDEVSPSSKTIILKAKDCVNQQIIMF